MKRAIVPLLFYLKVNQGSCTGISFVDSTPIKVCHNRRILRHKTFKGLAARGSMGSGGRFPLRGHAGGSNGIREFRFHRQSDAHAQSSNLYRVTTASHEAAFQRELNQRIDSHLNDRNFAVQSVQSGYLLQANATQAVNTLVIFLLIMAVLTVFVGSIGLTDTMGINVLERTREIGVMRTIGAVDVVIMQSVIIEGLFIGLITWLLAIGLSFPISSLLLTIIGEAMMGSAMTLSFTPLGILLWLGVVIFLSIFASIIPARNAARLTINEVLAYE